MHDHHQEQNQWTYLSTGSRHMAFVNQNKTLVFKVLVNQEQQLYSDEDLQRCIRIWNEINDGLKPSAKKVKGQILPEAYRLSHPAQGMITPFVNGRPPTDEELKVFILDVFNRTGRMMLNATNSVHYLTQIDGSCVCVDIDFYLQLDLHEDSVLSEWVSRRRPSLESLESIGDWLLYKKEFWSPGLDHGVDYPLTTKTLKALMFTKRMRPDIGNVSFLNGSIELDLLASAYGETSSTDMKELAQDYLEQERPAALSQLKSTCHEILNKFLFLDAPSGSSLQANDFQEIHIICQACIQEIQDAATAEVVIRYIESLRQSLSSKPRFSRLDIALVKCLLASDALYYAKNRKSLAKVALFLSKYVYDKSNLPIIAFIHTMDALNIGSKIFIPFYFLQMFNQNINDVQVWTPRIWPPIVILLLLPILTECKNKLLSTLSMNVAKKFTKDLIDVGFLSNLHATQRFSDSFSPDYVEQVFFFIRKTYGRLLPSYVALVGFGLAIGYEDKWLGGVSGTVLFIYISYICYFLNPRYSRSFKANLVENRLLHDQLESSIRRRDLVKFYNQSEEEKNDMILKSRKALATIEGKNAYESQIKVVGMIIGNVNFLVSAVYWLSSYPKPSNPITDDILLFYYLYTFSALIHQMSSLVIQLLSSAEKIRPLIQYSMWSEGRAQKAYLNKKNLRIVAGNSYASRSAVCWQLNTLTFEGVLYHHYHPKQHLGPLSFRIEKNNFFAFVGESLGDLSVVVRLLRREVAPLKGHIKFDTLPIDGIEERSFHALLTIVDSKDEFIYGHSWYDTIAYGKKNADDAQVLEAAFEAGLIESQSEEHISLLKTRFISRDDGYKTSKDMLEERRLAMARAILKGGECLILDNPTAGLAYPDEMAILQTLIRLSNQLITIMITDKLYLLDNYAHKIFYLKEGVIKEQDTYSKLLEAKTLFYETWLKQKKILEELSDPSEKFYTLIDTEKSVIARNFHPGGYASAAELHTDHPHNQDESLQYFV